MKTDTTCITFFYLIFCKYNNWQPKLQQQSPKKTQQDITKSMS